MSVMELLKLAEEIVARHGDPVAFARQYSLLREQNTVRASVELALRDQALWALVDNTQ